MTVRILLSSALLAASLAACASTSRDPRPTYREELDQLTADCRERGGILSPIPGVSTGRPQSEYACEIRGGASRIGN